jgi:hypothetical protein
LAWRPLEPLTVVATLGRRVSVLGFEGRGELGYSTGLEPALWAFTGPCLYVGLRATEKGAVFGGTHVVAQVNSPETPLIGTRGWIRTTNHLVNSQAATPFGILAYKCRFLQWFADDHSSEL